MRLSSVVRPTLKYGDEIIETNTIRNHSFPETVSCELYAAGPPLPESLTLVITEGDSAEGISTTDHRKDNPTCTWSYPEPLQFDVIDLTETVSCLQFLYDLNLIVSFFGPEPYYVKFQ